VSRLRYRDHACWVDYDCGHNRPGEADVEPNHGWSNEPALGVINIEPVFVHLAVPLIPPRDKYLAAFGVDEMDELARKTSHRLISIVIPRYRFIDRIALDAEAGVRTEVEHCSHVLR